MPTIRERELEFDLPRGAIPLRFDGANHGLSHCMKAVDFIVEFPTYYLFVEVKDPDCSKASPERHKLYKSELAMPAFCQALARKYRDSFIYRWAEKKTDKPIHYVVLLQLTGLGAPQYLTLQRSLQRELPTAKEPANWSRSIVSGLAVLDMQSWNQLGQYGTVKRMTS